MVDDQLQQEFEEEKERRGWCGTVIRYQRDLELNDKKQLVLRHYATHLKDDLYVMTTTIQYP